MWRTMLPSKVELFNLAQNPSESIDLSAENPQKVAELQARAEALAREAVAPLLLNEAKGVVWKVETGSVSLPEDYRLSTGSRDRLPSRVGCLGFDAKALTRYIKRKRPAPGQAPSEGFVDNGERERHARDGDDERADGLDEPNAGISRSGAWRAVAR